LKDRRFPDPIAAAFETDWRLLVVIFLLMIAVGVLAFLDGISGTMAKRAWQIYLINLLFWTGLANGAVLFAATLNMTAARWGRPLKRLAEAASAFLPFSLAFFIILYFGRSEIFPWISEPVPAKEWWLNVPFLFARDTAGLFLLTSVGIAMVYYSVKEDRKITALRGKPEGPLAEWISGAASTTESRGWKAQTVLSPVYGILYAVVLSILAIDLIMSLDTEWVSTLFPAYYFISSFYLALAAIFLLLIPSRKTTGLAELVNPSHMHDLGKLLLAFCVVTGDFFYSQFLVIWYGNLPDEVKYVLLRVRHMPWQVLAWAVLLVCFAIPFVTLLSRKIKTKAVPMAVLCGVIVVGMWLERLLLVMPSLWKQGSIPFGLIEIAITAGFFGTAALSMMAFFHLFPLVPVGDPLLREHIELRLADGEG
jgi:Ni/Fe-hydrogenase subunit HybB-like protein